MILAARDASSARAQAALEALCRAYWYPLYAYVRRKGYAADDAQDLTQEFFARLPARNYLNVADRNKGKFRSFLLGALEHFLAREWTKAHAQKRGGGQTVLSLDETDAENRYLLEPVHELTPEKTRPPLATTLLDKPYPDCVKNAYRSQGRSRQSGKPSSGEKGEVSCLRRRALK
jgi:RNA polymerase sigma-70 factor (ECF subfamily)